MRVAVLLEQALAPVPGGTGRYAVELAAALARTSRPTDSVAGWTAWHRDVGPATVPGVAGPRRLIAARRPLTVLWERGVGPGPRDADVVHAPTPLLPPRRAPLVVTVHDTVPWTHPDTLTAHGVRWHRTMIGRAARLADAVTVPTAAVAADLAAVLPQLSGRLRVLGAGVARSLRVEADADRAQEVARALGLPDRYVVSLATLEPRKGLDVAVAALGRLGASAPDLVVAGQPGWGGLDLASAAVRAGLSPDRVHVLGRIDDEQLGVVLRRAVALIAPSRAEGFGLPVAEAMAVGTPVVASDVPALVEVADGAALVVPTGDVGAWAEAIEGVTGDAALRTRLVDAGRRRSVAFDWDEVARRAWSLYRELQGNGVGWA